jgi:membrane associated rhomboid family serine protease
MIPIRDEIKTHRTPIVNYVLILINVAVFLWTCFFNANPDAVYSEFALFPYKIQQGLDVGDMRDILTACSACGWLPVEICSILDFW